MRMKRLVGYVCLFALSSGAFAQPYVVQPGDTLWDISKKRLNTPLHWPEIKNSNRVADPRLLRPGTTLQFLTRAVVLAVKGDAWRRDPKGTRSNVAPGQEIRLGDVFETGVDSFITLGLPGGSRSVLPSQTSVEVLSVDALTVRLKLLTGRIESQVDKQTQKQRFEIRTRSVGLAVRGTHFRVRDEDGRLFAEVLRGSVVTGERQGNRLESARSPLDGGQGAVLSGEGAEQGARELLPPPQLVNASEISFSRILSLKPVEHASGYRLQLAQDDRFLRPIYEQEFDKLQANLPSQLPAGFYHLRLTAFDKDRIEGKNEDIPLYMAGVPVPPVFLPDGRVEIRWQSAESPTRFELSRAPDFSTTVISAELMSSGVTVGPFPLAGKYYWRVLSKDETRTSAVGQGGFAVPVTGTR